MNKKYALIINIAMLVVGLIGILIYFAINKKPAVVVQAPPVVEQQVKEPEVIKENITVAVAQKDLKKGKLLNAEDFVLKTLNIPEGSNEKDLYAISKNIDSWMTGNDITAGSYIPKESLIEPGSEQYVAMSVRPGNIVYGFSIKQTDSYLFTNAHAGEGLDIYLSYNLMKITNENGDVSTTPKVNTTDEINDRHFKLLMKNKKILFIKSNNLKVGDNPLTNEGYVLVELTPAEVRTLKGLDDAKLYIFPTTENMTQLDFAHSVLVGNEGQWPIDNRDILSTDVRSGGAGDSVTEYRGSVETKKETEEKE
ncbi:hypothetical protein [Enterobacter sp.]|uniref:hypothetical protein n=1 Tax=Enterobacter sp. TaxID=42895 RepID=UPI00296FA77D|nr:hypothetical protein [Enterobacter sp.]